jgi:hypothetical protein
MFTDVTLQVCKRPNRIFVREHANALGQSRRACYHPRRQFWRIKPDKVPRQPL